MLVNLIWKRYKGQLTNSEQEMRSLFLNLKDKGNPALRNEIVLGYISTEKVASMSKDVNPQSPYKAVDKMLTFHEIRKWPLKAFECSRRRLRATICSRPRLLESPKLRQTPSNAEDVTRGSVLITRCRREVRMNL